MIRLLTGLVLLLAGADLPAAGLERVTAARVHELVRAEKPRVVLLNLWSTWCKPCMEKFPELAALARSMADRPFTILHVSTDFRGQAAAVEKTLNRYRVKHKYMKGQSDQEFITGIHKDWSGSLPFMMIFDKTGKVVFHHEGNLKKPVLLKRINLVMGKRS